MPPNDDRRDQGPTTSRRSVLAAVGGGALAATGLTAGERISRNPPDRHLVGLRSDAAFGVASDRADHVHREIDLAEVGKIVAGRFPEQALDALRATPAVRYVEREGRYQSHGRRVSASDDVTTRAGQTTPYGISDINADVALENCKGGYSASVAVLDSGADPDHEDLADNLSPGKAFESCSTSCGCHYCGDEYACPNYDDCENAWDDRDGHGTHVAGTVCAPNDGVGVVGVAPWTSVTQVKIADCIGCATVSSIADGFRYAADQGHDVANLSYGGPEDHQSIRDAVEYASNRDVVIVASAGNGYCSDCVSYPAAYDEVIAVTAVDSNGDPASFNSTGPEVDLTAPGVSVESTVPNDGYEHYSGTSMAAPHVAGTVALLLADGYSPSDAEYRLRSEAVDLGLDANVQGAGRVDAARALGVYAPGAETLPATQVRRRSAFLNGEVSLGDGAHDALDVYFEWGTDTSYGSSTGERTKECADEFSIEVQLLLEPDTRYYYRAVAEAPDGSETYYGDPQIFRTDA